MYLKCDHVICSALALRALARCKAEVPGVSERGGGLRTRKISQCDDAGGEQGGDETEQAAMRQSKKERMLLIKCACACGWHGWLRDGGMYQRGLGCRKGTDRIDTEDDDGLPGPKHGLSCQCLRL